MSVELQPKGLLDFEANDEQFRTFQLFVCRTYGNDLPDWKRQQTVIEKHSEQEEEGLRVCQKPSQHQKIHNTKSASHGRILETKLTKPK